jgi:hypothetical protein
MNNIHVNRERQNLGQFTPEDIADGLRSGRFLPTDLGWREEMETWQPLATFTDLPEPGELTPPIFAPGTPLTELEQQAVPVAPAWERPEGGLVDRLWNTIREVLGSPASTFAGMPTTGGFGKPLMFLLWLAVPCGVISIVYQYVYELVGPKTEAAQHLSPEVTMWLYVGLAIFMPVLVAAGSFLSSGILHLCLMLVGANPKSFEATYRVVAYANGSTSVLLLVPICGQIAQGIWNLCILVIGFREVHGTTTGKAVMAVLLPVLVCCGLFVAFMSLAIAVPLMTQMK